MLAFDDHGTSWEIPGKLRRQMGIAFQLRTVLHGCGSWHQDTLFDLPGGSFATWWTGRAPGFNPSRSYNKHDMMT